MRITVTGGAGFIGSHLVERLARAGHRVTVLDDLSTGSRANLAAVSDRIDLLTGDIRDRAAVTSSVAGADAVCHLAARVSVEESIAEPAASTEINVQGTALLLEASRSEGVRRLLFASSAAVYGVPARLPAEEGLPPHPLSPYGVQKLAGEHLARVLAVEGGLDTVSLRFFNVYGPRQRAAGYAAVLASFLARAAAGRPPRIEGSGSQTRDFVHVTDVAEGCLRALERPTPWGGAVLNVGTGRATSIAELARLVREGAGIAAPPEPAPPRPGDLPQSVASTVKLLRELGWHPRLDLARGLAPLLAAAAARAAGR